MPRITSYRELDVWEETRKLVKSVYQLTKKFPREEQFGLTHQLRRAAVSVPSNIAEGCGRHHFKDSTQFLFIARGSLYEVETQLILASDLEIISQGELQKEIAQIVLCKKLLNGLIKYFEKKQ